MSDVTVQDVEHYLALNAQYFTRDSTLDSTSSYEAVKRSLRSKQLVPMTMKLVPPKIDPNSYIPVKYSTSSNATARVTDTKNRTLENDSTRKAASDALKKDVQQALDKMKACPPIGFLINPNSFKLSRERPVDYARGRRGIIISMWLENQAKISISGKSAAQFTINKETKGGGLAGPSRIHSLSYANLLSIVQIYRSNAILYSNNDFDNGSKGVPYAAGDVVISYDGVDYYGSFDSFGITDSSESPHNLAYTIEFTVRHEVDAR